MKTKILRNGMSYIMGLQTLLFGLFLLFHKNFMETKGPYQLFTRSFDEIWIALLLIFIGVLFMLSVKFNWKSKKIWLSVMQFIWVAFFVAFFLKELSGVPNSAWVLIFGLNLSIVYEALQGGYR